MGTAVPAGTDPQRTPLGHALALAHGNPALRFRPRPDWPSARHRLRGRPHVCLDGSRVRTVDQPAVRLGSASGGPGLHRRGSRRRHHASTAHRPTRPPLRRGPGAHGGRAGAARQHRADAFLEYACAVGGADGLADDWSLPHLPQPRCAHLAVHAARDPGSGDGTAGFRPGLRSHQRTAGAGLDIRRHRTRRPLPARGGPGGLCRRHGGRRHAPRPAHPPMAPLGPGVPA